MPPTGASPSRIPAEATTFVGQVTSKRSSLTWEYSSESGSDGEGQGVGAVEEEGGGEGDGDGVVPGAGEGGVAEGCAVHRDQDVVVEDRGALDVDHESDVLTAGGGEVTSKA